MKDCVNATGETMLHLAARCDNEKAGLFLVNNGANCSATNDKVGSNKVCIGIVAVFCRNGCVCRN